MHTILDAEQLGEVLGMNPKTLQRMTREGLLPCHRVGNSVRYHLEEVLAHTRVAAHADDLAVDEFAQAMHAKMRHAREQGREGWDDPTRCTPERLASMLVDCVAKGDPVDVANFAMMLFARGAGADVLATAFVKAVREYAL